MEVMQSISGYLATVLLSVVLTILLRDRVHRTLNRLLGPVIPRKGRSLNGIWRSTYRFESNGVQKYENQVMRLRQSGDDVVGENLVEEHHEHRLTGRFRNEKYYTGTWENIAEGEIWHGSFQFVLSTDGNRMQGWWLGFDSEGVVRSGPWAWRLVSRATDRESLASYQNMLGMHNILEETVRPDIEKVRAILDLYSKAWVLQDPDLLGEVFVDQAIYRERAFDPPLMGIEEIKDYWRSRVVESQADIRFQLLDLFLDGNVAVAEWKAGFEDLKDGCRKEIKEVAILEMEGGKIKSLREYWASKKC